MAQYTQRTQPMHRGAGTEHGGGGGGALAYGGGGKTAGGVVAAPAPRAPPPAPYAPQNYPPAQLRLHQPGYGSAALTYTRESYGRGGGAVGDYRTGGTRMSLLGTAYLTPPPSAHHPPPADPPPFKKIRLTENRPPITALPHHQPLRVDTREPVNVYGTVEVLSPNPPSEPTLEDQSFRTTKDDLLQQISKVDREMALSEQMLSKLKNKMQQLQRSSEKPASVEEPEEVVPKHRSLAQCVYNDNKKKAAAAHALLAHLGPAVTYPLYNQPQDTEVYHENIRKHRVFRKRLVEHLKRVKQEQDKREASIAEEYSRRLAEWSRRVERIEQGQKRKAKDARNREFFEKVFPELRKQREERERFNRLGARVKSEAELEEIADGLHEQEHEDKKMRSLTVVPPLLRDPTATRPQYLDTNRRCLDMKDEHKELQFRNVWSSAEREVFREKYLQHPKNFGQIASFLPRKTVRDCVRFYYLSKKAEKYKQLLRKPRQRRTGRPRPAVEPELPPGVTTRLQRSQGGQPRTSETKEGEESGVGGEVGSIPVPEQPASPSPAAPAAPARSELSRSPPPLPPSPPPASSAPQVSVTVTTTSSCAITGAPTIQVETPVPASIHQDCTSVTTSTTTVTSLTTNVSSPAPALTPTPSTPTVPTSSSPPAPAVSASPVPAQLPGSAPATPQPAQPATPTQPPPTPEPAVTERTSTPSSSTCSTTTTVTTTASTGSNCAVCGKAGATRNVSRSRAVFYGLREDAAGARVCEECHCNCVRSRYTSCLVPTCPTPRVRAKRLRHLPPRWHDLSLELKRPLMEEFQIPSDLSKCCLACFKRITRRLETIGDGGVPEPSEEEAGRFRALLREHGAAWDRMATASGRSPASLKAFYYTYRKKFQLDALVAERVVPRGSETDSSVASSDETDSASAGSPRLPPPAPPPPRRRDEYDSSATETADEENDAPSAKLIPTSTPVSVAPAVSTAPVVSTPATATPPTPAVRNGPAQGTPISVRDVVLNMIEISLMKSNQPVPPPAKIIPNKNSVCGVRSPPRSLATLSVVTSPQPRAATITPLQDNQHVQPPANDNNVQVLLIEQRDNRPSTEPLLDLSVKRRQEPSYPQPQPSKPAATVYRNSVEYPAYRGQPERESPTQYNHKPKAAAPPPRPQLKQPSNTKGSITLGTPVETRFEARRTPEPKGGSITAGTPVHAHHAPDKRHLAEYYKQRRSPAYFPHQPPSTRPQSPSSFQNPVYSRSPYGLEQRQIIMADFITSQQMHGAGARRAGPPPPAPQPPSQEERSSPARYSPRPAHREAVSVIQRHTPMYAHHHPHPPPGHEAFTSLVDVASAATALPVPRDKQEHKLMPTHSPHHTQHDIRMQERIREAAMVQKYHQQQLQFQVERDRQQRAQIIERDRHIAMQNRELQNRELQNREMQNREMQNRELQNREMQSRELQNREMQNRELQNREMQNREMQNRELQNREMQNREMQNRELQNREIQNREMQNREMQNREMQNREMQNRELQNRELQNRELQNRELQNRELQNRERERAMAAMAERQIVLEQQHPGMMHERHHAQVVSSVENERRMATSTTYTPAKRTITPHHLERKDSRPVASAPPTVAAVAAPSVAASADGRRPNEGTLTAASLIDAIITHQISQTSDQRFPAQQGLIRETDNGVPVSASERIDARVDRSGMESPPSPHHTTSIKLGDLACNIITRDFRSPATNPITHHNQYAGSGGAPPADGYSNAAPPSSGPNANDEWKRKHAPYLEPVSPPDHHANRNSSNRRYVGGGGGGGAASGAGGGALTAAFDYVTHRIVEVMRSDHEAPAQQPAPAPGPQPAPTNVPPNNKLFVPATYYPYSALNVPTTHHTDAGTGGGASSAPPPPAAPPPPEPAPLMSAQYEPLSDED